MASLRACNITDTPRIHKQHIGMNILSLVSIAWLTFVCLYVTPTAAQAQRRAPNVSFGRALSSSRGRSFKNAAPVSLVLLHTQGEGSHAIAHNLRSFECVNFNTGEPFEPRNFKQVKKLRPKFVRTFYSTPVTNLSKALTKLWPFDKDEARPTNFNDMPQGLKQIVGSSAAWKPCQCEVRAAHLWATSGAIGMMHAMHLDVVVAIRTDLMRWSLSAYGDIFKEAGKSHPQFDKNYKVPKVEYNITKLQKISYMLIRRWRENLRIIEGLVRLKAPLPQVVIYERLLDNVTTIKSELHDFIQRRAKANGATCEFPPRKIELETHVHKAHSNNIEEFVINADEVKTFFKSVKFPTFSQLVKTQTQLCKPGLPPKIQALCGQLTWMKEGNDTL